LPGRSRQLAPFGVRGFRLLFASTLASSVGTLIAAIALAIDVKQRTNSGIWVGAVLLVEILPTVLVGLTLGPLLDRLDRRKLMVAADLVRVAVFAALPFATSATMIVALALVAGLATGFFRPAVYAGVPNLVSSDLLGQANGLLQAVENVAWAVGPLLGGALTAAWGPHTAYWINAVSFLVSAMLVVRIPSRLLQSATALTRGHWTDLKDGFAFVLRSRPLLAVVFAWGIGALGSGAITVSEVFLAQNTLHGGDFGYGLLYGATGAGLVVGSLWSSTVVERVGIARVYGGSLIVMALGFGGAGASTDIWMAAVCCVVAGVGNGGAVVCNALLVQRGTRDEIRGRALTFVMSATMLTSALGILLAGGLMGVRDARWVWLASAATIAVAAIIGFVLAREPAAQGAPLQAAANEPAN
jgi:MFS family permease